jgi:molybdopterin-guanine dinucleotide biosynthesis protein B
MKVIGIIGYSNSGKTTLIERLIPIFRARGLTVSAIKNAHHGFDMDRPGKDSYRYRDAGASQVLIATALRWALLTETQQRPATLDELLQELAPCDLVIVEGFKSEGHIPRIEVFRHGSAEPPIYIHDENVVAIATDEKLDARLPVLDLNAPAKIAQFIATHLDLGLH